MNGTKLHQSVSGRLRKFWIEIRSSLWFVPGVLVVAAAVLAIVLVEVDVAYAETLQKQRWEPLLSGRLVPCMPGYFSRARPQTAGLCVWLPGSLATTACNSAG